MQFAHIGLNVQTPRLQVRRIVFKNVIYLRVLLISQHHSLECFGQPAFGYWCSLSVWLED